MNRCSAVASAYALKTLFSNAIVMAVYPLGIVNVDLLRNLQLIHKAEHGPFYARKHCLQPPLGLSDASMHKRVIRTYLCIREPV